MWRFRRSACRILRSRFKFPKSPFLNDYLFCLARFRVFIERPFITRSISGCLPTGRKSRQAPKAGIPLYDTVKTAKLTAILVRIATGPMNCQSPSRSCTTRTMGALSSTMLFYDLLIEAGLQEKYP
jgi:hypothetical protein